MRCLRVALVMALFSMAISGGVRSAEQSADLPKVPRLSYPPPFKDVQVELPATITVQPEYRPRLPLYLALRPHFSPLPVSYTHLTLPTIYSV